MAIGVISAEIQSIGSAGIEKEAKAMYDNPTKEKNPHKKKPIDSERRSCDGDRRKISSKGYVRIPVVGWICRRERTRRKDDSMECFYWDD